MPLLTKFPYNQPGHPHWESLKELFSDYKLHETGVTGSSFYDEQMQRMTGMPPGEDRPWCCEYTKKAFVKAWNKYKAQYEFWHLFGQPHHRDANNNSVG